MLKIQGIETWYGAIQALKGISLDVKQGEIVALLGANGAGKSTTIMTITGILKPSKGKIEFLDQDITGMEAEEIAKIGIACVPEGRHIFPGLSVLDNLMLGATPRERASKERSTKTSPVSSGFFPSSREFKGRPGWQLSGGQLQMLAIGRGLMSNRRFCFWTSPRWAWRRSWCRRCSGSSRRSTRRVRPSCWWSRTPGWRS